MTRHLVEKQILEGDSVTMDCEVSKPDAEGIWFKEDIEVEPTEKYETVVDGKVQALTIHDAELEDEGEYTLEVSGDSTTAMLWVDGTQTNINNIPLLYAKMHTPTSPRTRE